MRLLAPSLLILALQVHGAEVSPDTVRVVQTAGNESNAFKHIQTKELRIFVSNASNNDVAGLTVRYFYFGKNLKTDEVVVLSKGEQKTDVKAHATATVEAPKGKATYSDEHGARVTGLGIRGNARVRPGNVRYREVDASGTKLIGYAVQVYSETQLLAEAYSEPSLKDHAK